MSRIQSAVRTVAVICALIAGALGASPPTHADTGGGPSYDLRSYVDAPMSEGNGADLWLPPLPGFVVPRLIIEFPTVQELLQQLLNEQERQRLLEKVTEVIKKIVDWARGLGNNNNDDDDNKPPEDDEDCDDCCSSDPVLLAHGEKIERALDLAISITGEDFLITREYSSRYDAFDYGMVGAHWTLSCFTFLAVADDDFNVDTKDDLMLRGNMREQIPYWSQTGTPNKWLSNGPTTQYIEETSVTIDSVAYPVWRLIEPGVFEFDFYRPGTGVADELVGLPLQWRDPYGNARTFEYAIYDYGDWTDPTLDTYAKPTKIHLNGTPGTSSEAIVQFTWHTDFSDTQPPTFDSRVATFGRLAQIEVLRGSTVTQSVEYTYYDEELPNDLGDYGNLVQVAIKTLVDDTEVGTDPYRTRIWQYRYHDPGASVPVDPPTERLLVEGDQYQLKAVFAPEQIEYYAQKVNEARTTPWSADEALEQAAAQLMTLDDDDVPPDWPSGQTAPIVFDLASKIIGYDLFAFAPTVSPVVTQYVQAGCGCGGSSTHGVKKAYTYSEHASTWRTTQIDDYRYLGGASEYESSPYRTTYYDLEAFGPDDVYYTRHKAVIETASPSREWVTRYDYDSSRNRIKEFSPASISNFDETAAGSSRVTVASSGLIMAMKYNGDNRLTEIRHSDGDHASVDDFHLLKKIHYPAAPLASNERAHLPYRVDLFRTAVTSPPSDPSADVETTWWTYGFHSSDALASLRISTEADREAENGPSTTGVTDPEALSIPVYDTYVLIDDRSRMRWVRAEDGALAYLEYDADTGEVTKIVENADPSGSGSPNPALSGGDYGGISVSGWGSFSDGNELTTTVDRDLLGRTTKVTRPGGVEHYTRREMRASLERPDILYYTVLEFPDKLGSAGFDGPASQLLMNAADKPLQLQEFTLDAAASYDPLNGTFTLESNSMGHGEVSRTTFQHTLSGVLESSRTWHDVGGVTGASSFYETAYEYDVLGRLHKIINENDTVTEYPSYDVLDRALEVRVGTTSVTPVTIAQYFYDDPDLTDGAHQGMGNGNLNYVIAHTGDDGTLTAATRETKLYFDYRDRLVFTENELAPHEALAYDNLGRVVKRAIFESVPVDPADPSAIDATTDRGLFTDFAYSQRGLRFRQRVAIDPGNLAAGYLETHRWFDSNGRTIESWGPNRPATKLAYDGLGRTKAAYVTDRGGDVLPGGTDNYLDADDVTGDHVVQQVEYRYIAEEGLVDLVTTRLRLHDDTATGALTAAGALNTYAGYVYDAANRPTHTVDFGTASSNDLFEIVSTPPTVPTSVPSSWWTDIGYTDKIVTGVTYNARGIVEDFTDGEGRVTRTFYDDLSRTVATIENFRDAGISWSSGRWSFSDIDQTGSGDDARGTDRATSFLYDASHNVVQQIAHLDDGSGGEKVQITEYVYDNSATGSPSLPANNVLPSMDVLKEVRYPQESGVDAGQPGTTNAFKVRYAYNRLGELRSITDQNSTIHSYERDTLGRTTRDRVGIVSADIDQRIKAIGFTYDDLSRIDKVSSYDAATGGTVKNEVQFTYTPLWQVDLVKQDVDSAINASGGIATETVDYDYATEPLATGNFSRRAGMDYPLEGTFEVAYGAGGSANDRISRAEGRNIVSGVGFTYDYLGLGMVAILDYADPDVQLDRTFSHDGKRRTQGYTTQAAGLYPGWDRFGRMQRQAWVDGNLTTHATLTTVPNVPSILEQTYAYDRASNRLANYDMRPGARIKHRSFEFEYDDLDRLIEARRGAWDGSTFTPSADAAAKLAGQTWEYDPLGNWLKFRADLNGDGDYLDNPGDRLEERTHNEANELTQMDPPGFGGTFTYDDAGNMRYRPTPSGLAVTIYTHDAWNRLVEVIANDGSQQPPAGVPIAQYEYNGLHWRTVKRADADDAAVGIDQQRHLYYDAAWRLIEERIDDGWDPEAEPLVHEDDRRAQQFWGLRYIDDAAIRRVQAYVNMAEPEDPPDFQWTDWEHFWYVTDAQFSVVALLDEVGNLVERASYDAYGRAEHRRPADLDGDGDVDNTDLGLHPQSGGTDYFIGDSGYSADYDLNRDGSEDDINDLLNYLDWWFPGNGATVVPDGHISETDPAATPNTIAVAPDNPIGYCGYVFNPEAGLYLARNRWYSPVLGRWLERDPAGYVDGASLYQYVRGSPLVFLDPLGFGTWFGGVVGDWVHYASYAINGRSNRDAIEIGSAGGDGASDGAMVVAEVAVEHASMGAASVDLSEYMDDPTNPDLAISRMLAEAGFTAAEIAIGLGAAKGAATCATREGAEQIAKEAAEKARKEAAEKAAKKNADDIISDIGCFVAGTRVLTPDGTVAIEELTVGDRVVAGSGSTSETMVDPDTWRHLTLVMPHPHGADSDLEFDVLRSAVWVDAVGAEVGQWIDFEFEELDIRGPALVLSIESCPEIEPGPGSVVLGTMTHVNGFVLELGLDGLAEPIRLTRHHQLYSVDRQEWLPARLLHVGERMERLDGSTATLTSIAILPGQHRVYNLEVETDHRYYVSTLQILAHNGNPCARASGSADDIPGNPFRGESAAQDAYKHLEKHHGVKPEVASERLHLIKEKGGLGAADDAVIGRTGDVYHPVTGEHLGSLTQN